MKRQRQRPQATRLPLPPTLLDLLWSSAALIGVALFCAAIRNGYISWM